MFLYFREEYFVHCKTEMEISHDIDLLYQVKPLTTHLVGVELGLQWLVLVKHPHNLSGV